MVSSTHTLHACAMEEIGGCCKAGDRASVRGAPFVSNNAASVYVHTSLTRRRGGPSVPSPQMRKQKMPKDYLFTSESVTEGHPDKVADQISDGVLDAIIAKDQLARVAVETLVKTGLAIVAGEVTTETWVDIPEVARGTLERIGYTDAELGFSATSCAVINAIDR